MITLFDDMEWEVGMRTDGEDPELIFAFDDGVCWLILSTEEDALRF